MRLHSRPKTVTDQEIQTVIQKIWRPETTKPASTKQNQDEKIFYSKLEYIPFQDIQTSNIRIINLAPPQRVQYSHSIKGKLLRLDDCLLLDDDALSEFCLEFRERIRSKKRIAIHKDNETQTNIRVQPHILLDEQVANIMRDTLVQTDITGLIISKQRNSLINFLPKY